MSDHLDADLCSRCGNQFPAGQVCDGCRRAQRVSSWERFLTWREFRRGQVLCMAYGGRFGDGETRVCGNLRGHLDSHAYDRIDDVLRPRGWCERDGVLVQLPPAAPSLEYETRGPGHKRTGHPRPPGGAQP